MINILCGGNVTSKELLKRVSIEKIFYSISGASKKLETLIDQLRFIKTVDNNQYKRMKVELPFITTSIFNPLIRKNEYFAYSECIVLDVDNLAEKNINITELKNKLKLDEEVMLLFASPSNNGLKILFRLNERIYDSMKYKVLYKKFSEFFSNKYSLNLVLDFTTCDTARACFMSFDRDAYYNPNALGINIYNFLPKTDFEFLDLLDKEKIPSCNKIKDTKNLPIDPEIETLKEIKGWLGVKIKQIDEDKNKNIFVPEKLEQLKPSLFNFLAEHKLEVYECIPISYGLKLKVKLNNLLAENNIFFGRKGFNVVISPKLGTDKQLNLVVKQLATVFFNQIEKYE